MNKDFTKYEFVLNGISVTVVPNLLCLTVRFSDLEFKVFFETVEHGKNISITRIKPESPENIEFLQKVVTQYWQDCKRGEMNYSDEFTQRPTPSLEELMNDETLKFDFYDSFGVIVGIHEIFYSREDYLYIYLVNEQRYSGEGLLHGYGKPKDKQVAVSIMFPLKDCNNQYIFDEKLNDIIKCALTDHYSDKQDAILLFEDNTEIIFNMLKK